MSFWISIWIGINGRFPLEGDDHIVEGYTIQVMLFLIEKGHFSKKIILVKKNFGRPPPMKTVTYFSAGTGNHLPSNNR
jgi:hypothetical protein